jgi:hypothetical protein
MPRTSKQRFEGKTVTEIRNRVIGQVGDTRLNQSLPPDTEVVVVVAGVVEHVEHDRRKKGLVRIQRIAVGEGYVLTEGIDADDLLMKLRADRQAELDELLGTPPLDFDGDNEPDDEGGGD